MIIVLFFCTFVLGVGREDCRAAPEILRNQCKGIKKEVQV